jgi:ribonuclease D
MYAVQNYTLVETAEALEDFYEANCNAEWIAVDTEFIGERRFETLLCLIQVASAQGFYLIDPILIKDLTLFLKLLENENILKITHAGENDYRLLNIIYGTIPKNVFDTQIASGFVGLGYPTSYGKLVEKELHVILDKGYAATDWEARPLKKKQLEYALSDVLHLYDMYEKLKNKLLKNKRLDWVKHETARWETAQYYERDPHREALMNTLMNNVRQPKQVFLLRIYEWRRNEAQRLNHSKEMILPAKFIAPILKGIDSGKQTLLDSRIIPDRIVEQHWKNFQALYQEKPTEEELNILKRLPPLSKEDPKKDVSMELLHVLVKAKCMESGIAPQLVMNKSDLTYAQPGEGIFSKEVLDWRTEFLGEGMMKWLNERGELSVKIDDDKVVITMKE